MKKNYVSKILLMLVFLALTLVVSAQKKKILYIGADAYATRPSDVDMKDSLASWGFDTVYMGTTAYNEAPLATVHAGFDGIFFGESVGSTSCKPYGANGAYFPIPCITLEAAVFGIEETRWVIFSETGGIVTHDPADSTDLQIKITDNTHYITEIFQKDQIVKWSNSTAYEVVPYIHGLRYSAKILAYPVAVPSNPDAWAMCLIEDFNLPSKIFWFTMTHRLINNHEGTPELFQIMKRAAQYVYNAIPSSAVDNKIIEKFNLTAFPNPAQDNVVLRFNSPEMLTAKVILMTVTGQQMDVLYDGCVVPGNNFVEFDASKYSSGVYLIKLQIGEKTEYTKLMVK